LVVSLGWVLAEFEARLCLRARLHRAENGVGDGSEDAGTLSEFFAEAGEDVAKTRQDHQAVGERDEAVVARVGLDLPLLLHMVLG